MCGKSVTGRGGGPTSSSIPTHTLTTAMMVQAALPAFQGASPSPGSRGERRRGGWLPTPLSRGELRSTESSSPPPLPSHYRFPGALFVMKAFKHPCAWMVMHSFNSYSLSLEPRNGEQSPPWTLLSRSSGAGREKMRNQAIRNQREREVSTGCYGNTRRGHSCCSSLKSGSRQKKEAQSRQTCCQVRLHTSSGQRSPGRTKPVTSLSLHLYTYKITMGLPSWS